MTDEETMVAGCYYALRYADKADDPDGLAGIADEIIAAFPDEWPVVVASALSHMTQVILAPAMAAFRQAGKPLEQTIAAELAGVSAQHPELSGSAS